MKTIVSLFLALTMAWSLSACGGTNPPKSSQSASTPSPSPIQRETNGNTVLTAPVDLHSKQMLYLWEEGNVPAVTEYTVKRRIRN